jgi:hypothetical protein
VLLQTSSLCLGVRRYSVNAYCINRPASSTLLYRLSSTVPHRSSCISVLIAPTASTKTLPDLLHDSPYQHSSSTVPHLHPILIDRRIGRGAQYINQYLPRLFDRSTWTFPNRQFLIYIQTLSIVAYSVAIVSPSNSVSRRPILSRHDLAIYIQVSTDYQDRTLTQNTHLYPRNTSSRPAPFPAVNTTDVCRC